MANSENKVLKFRIKQTVDEYPDISHYEGHLAGKDKKSIQLDNERLRQYNNGDWCMLILVVQADCIIHTGKSYIIHTITDALGRIESDGDKAYFEEIEKDMLENVKRQCDELGVKYDDDTPIERINVNGEIEV